MCKYTQNPENGDPKSLVAGIAPTLSCKFFFFEPSLPLAHFWMHCEDIFQLSCTFVRQGSSILCIKQCLWCNHTCTVAQHTFTHLLIISLFFQLSVSLECWKKLLWAKIFVLVLFMQKYWSLLLVSTQKCQILLLCLDFKISMKSYPFNQ